MAIPAAKRWPAAAAGAHVARPRSVPRVLEERELKALLLPLGLRVRDIPADGHCLYRSLEDQARCCRARTAAAAS